MSKELNLIDTPSIDTLELATETQLVKLDDLSLALVGGGTAIVEI